MKRIAVTGVVLLLVLFLLPVLLVDRPVLEQENALPELLPAQPSPVFVPREPTPSGEDAVTIEDVYEP